MSYPSNAEQLERLRVKVVLTREQAVTLAKWAEPHEVPAIWAAIRQYDQSAAYLKTAAERDASVEAKKQARLDADVPLDPTLGARCQASVPGRDRWPTSHQCERKATVTRVAFDDAGPILLCGTHRKAQNAPFRYTRRHG